MKAFVCVLALLFSLPGCALFDTIPEPVKEGSHYAAEFAALNERNIRFLNAVWHRILVAFIERVEPDAEKRAALIASANQLLADVEARCNPPAEFGTQLADAIDAYMKEPGIGLDRIIGLIKSVKDMKP